MIEKTKIEVGFKPTENSEIDGTRPIESSKYVNFSPLTFSCKCGGTFKLHNIDDCKTQWLKCDKCENVVSYATLTMERKRLDCDICEIARKDNGRSDCIWCNSETSYGLICQHAVKNHALLKIRRVFHKWFKYEDETLLDLCLAVRIHASLLGFKYKTPLWLFIVGVSGDRKSATVESFIDDSLNSEESSTYFMNYITPNTLASGFEKNVKNDLAPKLKNKLVITGDFAQFLKMPIETKSAIWSQFREAYCGRVQKKTGSGVETLYTNNYWDWLVCSTPAIDAELLLKDELGTRELIYRIPNETNNLSQKNELMEAVWNNIEFDSQRKSELREAVEEFLEWYKKDEKYVSKIVISDWKKKKLFEYADFITQLRVSAESDPRSGDLTNFVYPEKPTRILEQLKMLFICLKQLDYDYSDEDALKRIFEVVKSSIHPVRLKILLAVKEGGKLSTTQIARKVKLAYATTNRELQICLQLKILERSEERGMGGEAFMWSLDESHSLIKILNEFDERKDRSQEESTKQTIDKEINSFFPNENNL